LKYEYLLQARDDWEELDRVIFQHEEYLDEYGMPYCDYRIYRGKTSNIKPIK
jgi:hypothetical protein